MKPLKVLLRFGLALTDLPFKNNFLRFYTFLLAKNGFIGEKQFGQISIIYVSPVLTSCATKPPRHH